MEIHTLLMATLVAFLSGPTGTALPNLCDDVHLDDGGVPLHDATGRTLARYCEQTGPRAPTWGRAVCCSFSDGEARCEEPDSSGACSSSQKDMWCDHGARRADGTVACYQPLPSACEVVDCVAPPPAIPLEAAATPLCCFAGGCFELSYEEHCGGFFTMCLAPYSNENGSVGCADLE